jgi:hypothetical protein
MNHSLLTADAGTHLKMCAISLAAAIIVVAVGLTNRPESVSAVATEVKTGHPWVRADAAQTYAATGASALR